jgi:hypothetical protein
MEKEFVTYEIGLELKNLGFNERCYGCFSHLDNRELWASRVYTNGVSENIAAPIFSQAFRWFEENYSYFVDIKTDTTPNEILGFDYTIKSWKFPPMVFDFFKDKREGNIAVIKKMIEMVKKEKQKEILINLMNLDNDDKINNMTPKQQDAIDNIMDHFKFEQVRQVMELLNWEWEAAEEGIPTVPELRQQARRLLKMAFEEKTNVSTGGFHVKYESDDDGEYIQLLFAVDEWDEEIKKNLSE